MKKLLLVEVPDGVELNIDSFSYGLHTTVNGIGAYVSYTIPVKEIQLPKMKEMCDEAENYFYNCPKGEKKNADIYFLRGANWLLNKIYEDR